MAVLTIALTRNDSLEFSFSVRENQLIFIGKLFVEKMIIFI